MTVFMDFPVTEICDFQFRHIRIFILEIICDRFKRAFFAADAFHVYHFGFQTGVRPSEQLYGRPYGSVRCSELEYDIFRRQDFDEMQEFSMEGFIFRGSLDEVVDKIEDVVLRLYCDNIRSIRPEMIAVVDIIEECCSEMKLMMEDFIKTRVPPVASKSL